MAGRHMFLPLARTKILANQIGILQGDIEQTALTGSLVMCDGRLIQVTAVIEFVAVQLFPTLRSPPAVQSLAFVRHTRSQVAVRLLGCPDQRNNTVQISI